MGYYQGNGVTVNKSARGVFYGQEWIPSWTLDGVPQGWVLRQYKGVIVENVTRKAGIQEPTYSSSSGSITMSTGNSPHETSSTTRAANRIGDSNLWEETITERTTYDSN